MLKLGAIPSQNFPKKSCESKPPVPRRPIVRNTPPVPASTTKSTYNTIEQLKKKTSNLKLTGWAQIHYENSIHFQYQSNSNKHIIPKYDIVINDSLEFDCLCFGWALQDDSPLYKEFKRNIRKTSLSNLLKYVESLHICKGLQSQFPNAKAVRDHIIPLKRDLSAEVVPGSSNDIEMYRRAPSCYVLLNDSDMCPECDKTVKKCKQQEQRILKNISKPAKKNAPLSATHRKKVELALIEERKKNKALLKEKIDNEIAQKSVKIDKDIAGDISSIMNNNKENMTPFMQLFWDQQVEASQKAAMMYHPMVIRFCLSLASKSASAYDELRSSGILTLPSRRTLRDYRNAITPQTGFNHKVVEKLKGWTKDFKGYQKYVSLAFDEMKIQENLVFDKYTGELVGFVDLGDPELNYSCFDESDKIASHMLAFYLRGVGTDLQFTFAYFATSNIKASQLMPIFWEAVAILELTCKLAVISTVSDGASPNRKFYDMHKDIDTLDSPPDDAEGEDEEDKKDEEDDSLQPVVVYKTVNLFAPHRFLWFFSDAPHLMKTIRNCIYQSSKLIFQ